MIIPTTIKLLYYMYIIYNNNCICICLFLKYDIIIYYIHLIKNDGDCYLNIFYRFIFFSIILFTVNSIKFMLIIIVFSSSR